MHDNRICGTKINKLMPPYFACFVLSQLFRRKHLNVKVSLLIGYKYSLFSKERQLVNKWVRYKMEIKNAFNTIVSLCITQRIQPLDTIQIQLNPIYNFTPYFFKIHFSIILPLWLDLRNLHFRLSEKICMNLSTKPYYTSRSSHRT